MQIREYFRGRKRLVAALIVIPLLAGILTTWYLARQGDDFTATLQVQTPASEAKTDSQIGLYAAKLSQAVQFPSTVTDVAQRTGIAPEDLALLNVTRIGQSDQIEVLFTAQYPPEQVMAAAQEMTRQGILRVAQAGGSPQSLVDAAQNQLASAQEDLATFAARNNITAGVTSSSGSSRSSSSTSEVAVLSPPVRNQYNTLQARVDAAQQQLTEAQRSLSQYQAAVADADRGTLIVNAVVVPEPRYRPIAEGAGVAVVISFLVVFGASLIPDLLRRQPRRRHAASDGTAESAAEDAFAAPSSAVEPSEPMRSPVPARVGGPSAGDEASASTEVISHADLAITRNGTTHSS